MEGVQSIRMVEQQVVLGASNEPGSQQGAWEPARSPEGQQ